VQHKQFIYAGGKLIALNTQAKDSAHKLVNKQVRYLHYDALDSVDMITDGYGNVVEHRSFDPWGKMRSVIWEDDRVTNIAQQLITNRGFTGHEHIEEVGLIHMNGRVYDQELGRFLSADPLIQAPFVTNSFNRYSYVMNNPLKYTDPTGFSGDDVGACTADNPDSQACKTPSLPRNGGGGGTGGETKTTETEDQNLTGDQLDKWLHERFGDQSINSVPVTPIGLVVNDFATFIKDMSINLSANAEVSLSSAVVFGVGRYIENKIPGPDVIGKVMEKLDNFPVTFDAEFATKQLLGTTKTPGGKQINFHAADRMVNPPKGRLTMSISQVEDFIDTADKIKKIKIENRGTSVTLMNSKYPKAQVAIDGNRIITVVNPRKKK